MTQISYCRYCKQPYASERSDSAACSTRCRVAISRLLKNFHLEEEQIPYAEAIDRYKNTEVPQLAFIKDYQLVDLSNPSHSTYCADVYIANQYSEELALKMQNKRPKIRVINGKSTNIPEKLLISKSNPKSIKNNSDFKIVHLDDHILYSQGLNRLLLNVLPNMQFCSFVDSKDAMKFISQANANKEKIDLIITDFIHPGANGYEFAKAVRLLEKKNNVGSRPILLITMQGDSPNLIQQGLKQKYFNYYLPKDFNVDRLNDAIHRLLNISTSASTKTNPNK